MPLYDHYLGTLADHSANLDPTLYTPLRTSFYVNGNVLVMVNYDPDGNVIEDSFDHIEFSQKETEDLILILNAYNAMLEQPHLADYIAEVTAATIDGDESDEWIAEKTFALLGRSVLGVK